MDFMATMALRSQGLDDNDIALIDKELPEIDNLIAVFQGHQAQINRVLALLAIVRKVIAHQRAVGGQA